MTLHGHRPPVEPASIRRLSFSPDLLGMHRANPERYPHLLESVAHGTAQGRFDILFAFPGECLELSADGSLHGGAAMKGESEFLDAFHRWWRQEYQPQPHDTDLPFLGGWFLYLGYELAAEVEPSLQLPVVPCSLPTAHAVRIPAAIIHDHATGADWLVAEAGHAGLLERMEQDARSAPAGDDSGHSIAVEDLREDEPSDYLRAVERIKRYIVEGDVFQVNLARSWSARLGDRPAHADLYARLRHSNPGPFAGLASWGDRAVISSSPERLVRVSRNQVDTRPIAGTHPRGGDLESDQVIAETLLAHPKERAEHIMLIDLERNDLGRVCVAGTVEVNELMVLETYAHVHHIVSNVRGRLREEVGPADVIRAVFPGGTITGCPKVRCMEIIAELEGKGRGPYTGSMGYVNRDGSLDLNILIRTLVREGGRVSLRAGAGIVADSVPQRELEETRNKARGLLLALQ
jgi:anthranilate synthase component 1